MSHWQDDGQQFAGIHPFMIVVAKPEWFLALMDTIVPHLKAGMSKRSAFARSGKSDRVFRRFKSIHYLQQINRRSYEKVSNIICISQFSDALISPSPGYQHLNGCMKKTIIILWWPPWIINNFVYRLENPGGPKSPVLENWQKHVKQN